jgi:hypothetical protein
VDVQSAAALALVSSTSAPSCWDEEVERLLAAAPRLGDGPRGAVRTVLRDLLDDPGVTAGEAGDVAAVLHALAVAAHG